MSDAVLFLLVLLLGAICFYLAYDRMKANSVNSDSSQYVDSLKDLLDGREEAAFSKLRQVVAEDTNNLDAYLRLGAILRSNKQPERALQIHKDLTLRTTLSRNEKISILRQLAADYTALGEPSTAEKALRELISLDSRDRWAHASLLKLHEQSGNWDGAYETATHILKLESNKSKKPLARLKYLAGEDLFKKREYHKARVALKEAISLDPAYVAAYLAIGDSYYEEKRFEDAVNIWNKLITTFPEQGDKVIERLKKTLFELGRYGEIVDICQTILVHAPKNGEARRTLARLSEKKGDLTSAIEILEQIVEDTPDDQIALFELGRLYIEKGEKKKLDTLVRSLKRKSGAGFTVDGFTRSDMSRVSV
ncbi:MAG: tetratricopeptide repeat protein [candidate division Zixibacteria bacterium]|nr:tetratricopeptide repeat protein [candidate division Zixibacteria bacterium]